MVSILFSITAAAAGFYYLYTLCATFFVKSVNGINKERKIDGNRTKNTSSFISRLIFLTGGININCDSVCDLQRYIVFHKRNFCIALENNTFAHTHIDFTLMWRKIIFILNLNYKYWKRNSYSLSAYCISLFMEVVAYGPIEQIFFLLLFVLFNFGCLRDNPSLYWSGWLRSLVTEQKN